MCYFKIVNKNIKEWMFIYMYRLIFHIMLCIQENKILINYYNNNTTYQN